MTGRKVAFGIVVTIEVMVLLRLNMIEPLDVGTDTASFTTMTAFVLLGMFEIAFNKKFALIVVMFGAIWMSIQTFGISFAFFGYSAGVVMSVIGIWRMINRSN